MYIKEDEREKRGHYRVDDEIEFAYCPMVDAASGGTRPDSEIIEQLCGAKGAKHYHLMRALRQIDEQASEEWTQLLNNHPSLASYLKLLNRKLDLLLNELFLSEQTTKHKVNLSLGGIAFFAKEALPIGCRVKMKLVLKPSFDILLCQAEVVRVDRYLDLSPIPLIKVSAQFLDLSEQEEKLLSRHVMYRQTELLKNR